MKILPAPFACLRKESRPVHLAIGMFDGVHLGHRAVLRQAREAARSDGGLSGVLTFEPHPSHLFRPESPTPMIYPPAAKQARLREFGMDLYLEQPFHAPFAARSATEFLEGLLATVPTLTSVAVGSNFRFGKGREGDAGFLHQFLGKQRVRVHAVDRVQAGDEAVSSTRIRRLLATEPVETVRPLLVDPYLVVASVQTGKQLGRTIGFPTLNLPFTAEIRPLLGVYFARYRLAPDPPDAAPRPAVANLGLRPTVEESTAPVLEVHSLDEPGAGPGATLLVELLHLRRREQKFSGLEALRAAITEDTEAARAHFRSLP